VKIASVLTDVAAIDCLLFRSGSYTSPVIHKRCNSTANFRATAITARFLAFFPPRAQMRWYRGLAIPLIYLPSKRRLEEPNGARSLIFTADELEGLRGKQCTSPDRAR
jgi:hypothetical protein